MAKDDDAQPLVGEVERRLDELIAGYRESMRGCLEGLSEDEARLRLVPSKTTLLGLVKHLTYVEAVWFDEAVTGRSAAEIGNATSPDRSFVLRRSDTIASVLSGHEARCATSDRHLGALSMDEVVTGRGGHSVWALKLQVLRELAHHQGHADILREQVLARR